MEKISYIHGGFNIYSTWKESIFLIYFVCNVFVCSLFLIISDSPILWVISTYRINVENIRSLWFYLKYVCLFPLTQQTSYMHLINKNELESVFDAACMGYLQEEDLKGSKLTLI